MTSDKKAIMFIVQSTIAVLEISLNLKTNRSRLGLGGFRILLPGNWVFCFFTLKSKDVFCKWFKVFDQVAKCKRK